MSNNEKTTMKGEQGELRVVCCASIIFAICLLFDSYAAAS